MGLPAKISAREIPAPPGGINTNVNYTAVPVLIGSIDFNDVNAEPANPSVIIAFANTKPANKFGIRYYFKVIQTFSSPTRDIASLVVGTNFTDNIGIAAPGNYVAVPGTSGLEETALDSIGASITFAAGGNNPQDFTAGSLEVYAEFITFPTL